jgi:hypothetical protein
VLKVECSGSKILRQDMGFRERERERGKEGEKQREGERETELRILR